VKTTRTAAALLVLWLAASPAATRAAEGAGPPDAPKGVRLVKDEQRIRVEINGQHFTDYNYGVEEGAPSVTQFFYPLKAPDGTELAADQYARKKARLPGDDHPHQRALRFSHLYTAWLSSPTPRTPIRPFGGGTTCTGASRQVSRPRAVSSLTRAKP